MSEPEDPLDLENEVWLALDIANGCLGASCVDFLQKKLSVFEDTLDANSVEITRSLIVQLTPTRVFVSCGFPESIRNLLHSAVMERKFDVELVKVGLFDYECGKEALNGVFDMGRGFQLMRQSSDCNVSVWYT